MLTTRVTGSLPQTLASDNIPINKSAHVIPISKITLKKKNTDANTSGEKFDDEQDIYRVPKYLPRKYLILNKSEFTMVKPGGYLDHLNDLNQHH